MKKTLIVVAVVALALVGCRRQKELIYFNGLGDTAIQNTTAQETKDYKIRMHDILYIRVLSWDAKINGFFEALSGTSSNQTTMLQEGGMYYTGYSVDQHGMIDIPELGKISVLGKTVDQARELIRARASKDLKDATVIVKLSNMKYTFLGEVNMPGIKQNLNNQTTILEAIALAGDLTDYGDRKNVLVIRPTVDGSTSHHLDLNDPKLLSSPYYYLKPNDVIYVPPLKAKATKMFAQDYGIFLSIFASTMATAALIVSLVTPKQ